MTGKRPDAGKDALGRRAPRQDKRARSLARRLALQALYQIQINPRSWADTVQQYAADPEADRVDLDYFRALIALGAVIRGQTPHFDYVAGECAGGIARIALESGVPIAFGVLTTDTVEQAVDRAGGKAGNKGADAALVAMEMANLLRRLDP